MQDTTYLTSLLISVLLVVIDGQVIYRSGRSYLKESYGDSAAGLSMTRLVTVLFHLVVLGLLALISTMDIGGRTPTEVVVLRLGVVLLLLAVAHAATMGILSRIRDRQEREKLTRATMPGPRGALLRDDTVRSTADEPDQDARGAGSTNTDQIHDDPQSVATRN